MVVKYTLDWREYELEARQAVAEGVVLVENNGVLPFSQGNEIAVFGRMQSNYYKSGTGSGGMVNVYHVTDIVEGLEESGIIHVNDELRQVYKNWEETHPVDKGLGWGQEPWSQAEMVLDEETVSNAAKRSAAALVIIARTAGEDKDSSDAPGSFRLTEIEIDMLKKVRNGFDKMVVLLNVGGIIDMHFVDEIKPDAVLYAWQGGMTGGAGTADVLTGKVSPSGHLTDTAAYEIEDYLSDKNFGDKVRNFYADDIYVGYRYFETFAPDRVRYPFGYGLSYTSFDIECTEFCVKEHDTVLVNVKVTNTGDYAGKQVVQLYASAPQGKLGKPVKVLIGFEKTRELKPGESEQLSISCDFYSFASYDDSGVTGHKSSYILEAGTYSFYIGENVRDVKMVGSIELSERVLATHSQSLAPYRVFERVKPEKSEEGYSLSYESVPKALLTQNEKAELNLPQELKQTGDMGIKLLDVLNKKHSLDEFVAQLSDDELAAVIRGEGMGSSLVTPGTAAAFGGVSESLRKKGIPAVCCDDGPSGMRLDSGAKAFSLPIGTLLGCTFNRELNQKLFEYLSLEMITNRVDCLLGPGMNIHRHILNGRNFEYFSEDPYLTGEIATAQLKGLRKYGQSGTVKHFAANNQEYRRRHSDSVVSERAMREIYLKGFEKAVRSGYCDSVMTTYGKLNGRYTSNVYDLTTTILRDEWNFEGIVMTDWWAATTELAGNKQGYTDFASMARAQNDLYMVCPNAAVNSSGDNTLEQLEKGNLTRGELQRNAKNICRFAMHTEAMKRITGQATEVEVLNKPMDADEVDMTDVEFTILDGELVVALDDRDSVKDTNYVIALDSRKIGDYRLTLRGSSTLDESAQMTCTLFTNGFPICTMTFQGTGGELASVERELYVRQRFVTLRLHVGADGLKLKDLHFEYIGEHPEEERGIFD
jgi:beta-glucosidase